MYGPMRWAPTMPVHMFTTDCTSWCPSSILRGLSSDQMWLFLILKIPSCMKYDSSVHSTGWKACTFSAAVQVPLHQSSWWNNACTFQLYERSCCSWKPFSMKGQLTSMPQAKLQLLGDSDFTTWLKMSSSKHAAQTVRVWSWAFLLARFLSLECYQMQHFVANVFSDAILDKYTKPHYYILLPHYTRGALRSIQSNWNDALFLTSQIYNK
jgi:hypothetical protein